MSQRRKSISRAEKRAVLQTSCPTLERMPARVHDINNGRVRNNSAVLGSAHPELRCSRHAEDSSYASPSQNGGDPSCGLILEGPWDGESVFVDGDGAGQRA